MRLVEAICDASSSCVESNAIELELILEGRTASQKFSLGMEYTKSRR
jgi:hypothetical protein